VKQEIWITCCAAAKDPVSGELPAARRYLSTRIDAVGLLAARRGAEFRILSGKYGLLAPETPIPAYDHLLGPAEVDDHAGRVAQQLTELAPARVVYFTRPAATDPEAAPYRRCCEAACSRVGIPCEVVEVPDGPLTAQMLEDS